MRLYAVGVDESAALPLSDGEIMSALDAGRILSRFHMDKVYTSSSPVSREMAGIAVPYLKENVWKELDVDTADSLSLPGSGAEENLSYFMKEMESEDPDVFIAVFAGMAAISRMISYVRGETDGFYEINPVELFSFRYGKWSEEDPLSF